MKPQGACRQSRARGEQSGGWLSCRARESHVKRHGARERERERESCLVLGLVPGRCDKVRDDDGWRGTDETEQSLFPLPQSSSIED